MTDKTDERFAELGEACTEAGKAVEAYLDADDTEKAEKHREMLRRIAEMKVLMIDAPWKEDDDVLREYNEEFREVLYKQVRKIKEKKNF